MELSVYARRVFPSGAKSASGPYRRFAFGSARSSSLKLEDTLLA
jgi:hypothetical protein